MPKKPLKAIAGGLKKIKGSVNRLLVFGKDNPEFGRLIKEHNTHSANGVKWYEFTYAKRKELHADIKALQDGLGAGMPASQVAKELKKLEKKLAQLNSIEEKLDEAFEERNKAVLQLKRLAKKMKVEKELEATGAVNF